LVGIGYLLVRIGELFPVLRQLPARTRNSRHR
jgi:hypothetical protein